MSCVGFLPATASVTATTSAVTCCANAPSSITISIMRKYIFSLQGEQEFFHRELSFKALPKFSNRYLPPNSDWRWLKATLSKSIKAYKHDATARSCETISFDINAIWNRERIISFGNILYVWLHLKIVHKLSSHSTSL